MDKVSRPYETADKIIDLCSFFVTFIDGKRKGEIFELKVEITSCKNDKFKPGFIRTRRRFSLYSRGAERHRVLDISSLVRYTNKHMQWMKLLIYY